MDGKDLKIGKRVSGLVATGALPATIVGVVGDLFTPRGGWIVVGAIGLLASVLAVYVIASIWRRGDDCATSWWQRTSKADADLNWIWEGKSPFSAHGVHVLVVFAAASLFFAQKSFADIGSGGVIAKNVTAIAVAQEQLGIAKESLREQKRGNEILASIDSKAGTLKKETSDDPRKELSNAGVRWESASFYKAVQIGDVRSVTLFLEGRMPISRSEANAAFIGRSAEVRQLLAAHAELFDPEECKGFISNLSSSRVLSADRQAAALVTALCANEATRALVKTALAKSKVSHDEQLAAYRAAEAAQQKPADCVRTELRNGARNLLEDVSRFNIMSVSTMTPRQEMLADLQASMMIGKDTVEATVRAYCNRQATEKPNIATDDAEVRRWTLLSDWVS